MTKSRLLVSIRCVVAICHCALQCVTVCDCVPVSLCRFTVSFVRNKGCMVWCFSTRFPLRQAVCGLECSEVGAPSCYILSPTVAPHRIRSRDVTSRSWFTNSRLLSWTATWCGRRSRISTLVCSCLRVAVQGRGGDSVVGKHVATQQGRCTPQSVPLSSQPCTRTALHSRNR